MPRRPAAEPLPLDLGAVKIGRHEREVVRTLRAAVADGRMAGDMHAAARSALRALGRAMDSEERKLGGRDASGYTAAAVHREMRETLTAYGLAPYPAEGTEHDDGTGGGLADVLRLGLAARGDPGPGGRSDDGRPGARSALDGRP